MIFGKYVLKCQPAYNYSLMHEPYINQYLIFIHYALCNSTVEKIGMWPLYHAALRDYCAHSCCCYRIANKWRVTENGNGSRGIQCSIYAWGNKKSERNSLDNANRYTHVDKKQIDFFYVCKTSAFSLDNVFVTHLFTFLFSFLLSSICLGFSGNV